MPANVTSAGFTATAAAVTTAQAVTMTASAGTVTKNFTLQLNAAILALTINATSVAFGDVIVNTSATQSVTLTSTGTMPVTISGAKATGAGFTILADAFPATLNPGQQTALSIEFSPTTVGSATGQLTITSNSSSNGTAVIGLSGTGTAQAQVVAVTVTPKTASTTTGAVQQFAGTVTGTTNTAVTWTTSGTGCSGNTCGTISSSGLYTAPTVVPSPATVTITATSVSDPSKSASATVTVTTPAGNTYYIAPAAAGGSDSNNGTDATHPWLTPNHSVNCGDVLLATPGNYSYLNFNGTWGTVTCPAANNVAWLKCAIFDACKINQTSGYGYSGMAITASYWGVQGWGITTSGSNFQNCIAVIPAPGTTSNIDHIVIAKYRQCLRG